MTRDEAIKEAIKNLNNLGGLMEKALEFNEATVEATHKTVSGIESACAEYRMSLYELMRQGIEWDEVLDYCEKGD